MFCDEIIEEVFECTAEYDDSVEYHFDCYHDMALHVTQGYRIILKTKTYFICIGYDGVRIVPNTENVVSDGEWFEPCIHILDEESGETWIDYESTLFVGEKLLAVKEENGYYILTFTDFVLKVIPHDKPDEIEGLCNKNYWSYNYVFGLDRLLTRKCDCGGTGEVLLDFVSDYVVRCNKCKKSTYAEMMVANAIEKWNSGETPCDALDIEIE